MVSGLMVGDKDSLGRRRKAQGRTKREKGDGEVSIQNNLYSIDHRSSRNFISPDWPLPYLYAA